VRRRHADVDDGQIGLHLPCELDQFGAVARTADHFESHPVEQARKPLSQQHIIIGDDDTAARLVRDRPGAARSLGRAVDCHALPLTSDNSD
jgi:hypothetical protein